MIDEPSAEMFRALGRDATLAERVTEQITSHIVNGQLQPGDRLPPERGWPASLASAARSCARQCAASWPKGWLKNDIAFHAGLAEAIKNELVALLLDSITDIMVTVRRLGFGVPNAALRAAKYPRAILKQVQQGNAEGAREAMRDHLAEAEATMRQALAQQAATHVGALNGTKESQSLPTRDLPLKRFEDEKEKKSQPLSTFGYER